MICSSFSNVLETDMITVLNDVKKETQNYHKGKQTDYKDMSNDHRDPKQAQRTQKLSKRDKHTTTKRRKNPQRDKILQKETKCMGKLHFLLEKLNIFLRKDA